MGADIHWHVETKYRGDIREPDEATWKYNHCLSLETDPYRNYTMFGLLAGVRGGDGPLYEPRGVPEDSDVFTVGDCHTPSWLTIEELMEVLRAYVEYVPVADAFWVQRKWSILDAIVEHEVRVVFWFDS